MRVTAAVIERRGKVLIARRKREARYGGLWEFPGGKIDEGETETECLTRELSEELGIETRAEELLCRTLLAEPDYDIELLTYRVRLLAGEPEAREHEELRWSLPDELDETAFPELDRPVVRLLRQKRGGGEEPRREPA